MSLLDNLVSYWKLDEASGNALDAHGSNELTETSGTIGAATGKITGARDFEAGDTEYFTIASNSSLQTGDIDWTFSAWINLESDVTGCIAGKGVGLEAGNYEWELIRVGGGNYRLYMGGTFRVAATLADVGSWIHVLVWHDATNNVVGISLNGSETTESYSGGETADSSNFSIGAENAPSRYFDGLICECGFWKRVLTSTERDDLYNSGNGLSYDDFGDDEEPVTTLRTLTLLGVGT